MPSANDRKGRSVWRGISERYPKNLYPRLGWKLRWPNYHHRLSRTVNDGAVAPPNEGGISSGGVRVKRRRVRAPPAAVDDPCAQHDKVDTVSPGNRCLFVTDKQRRVVKTDKVTPLQTKKRTRSIWRPGARNMEQRAWRMQISKNGWRASMGGCV